MLANIRVIAAVFCTIYFLAISEVAAPEPDAAYLLAHSGKICKNRWSADKLNSICRALATTYQEGIVFPDKNRIRGTCEEMYFALGGGKQKADVLACNVGPGEHRCVTTTNTDGTYHSWDVVQMTAKIMRMNHVVMGCSYLGSFTVSEG